MTADASAQEYIVQYNGQVDKCLAGDLAKTPQYLMIYVKLVNYSVPINDYELCRLILRQSMSLYFAKNGVHYALYGAYYVQSLDHLENTHPGAKGEVTEKGLYELRSTFGIGHVVDLAGEQSHMKSAKTAGGISKVASKEITVAKWVMNRPFQAKFAESSVEISGLTKTTSSIRKCLRPIEILKSNEMVENITNCLMTQFLNL